MTVHVNIVKVQGAKIKAFYEKLSDKAYFDLKLTLKKKLFKTFFDLNSLHPTFLKKFRTFAPKYPT